MCIFQWPPLFASTFSRPSSCISYVCHVFSLHLQELRLRYLPQLSDVCHTFSGRMWWALFSHPPPPSACIVYVLYELFDTRLRSFQDIGHRSGNRFPAVWAYQVFFFKSYILCNDLVYNVSFKLNLSFSFLEFWILEVSVNNYDKTMWQSWTMLL